MARKSLVLLKNDKQTLPISPKVKTVAVIGALAASSHEILGGWRAAGVARQ